MIGYITLTDVRKREILATAAATLALTEQVMEKDAWVTLVLEALFSIPGIGEHLVFKGGTSLSKGYNLINRFSEDIDFAIDRKVLGFGTGPLNPSQIKKLRKTSNQFIRERLIPELRARMLEMGVPENQFDIDYNGASDDTDPLPVRAHFHSVLTPATSPYLAEQVLVEISARSLMEPAEDVQIKSLIAEAFPDAAFSGNPFTVSAVWPGRTFLEKLFLLHEQFAQAEIQLPRNRMSRHLYDVEKLMDTEFAVKALANRELYDHIIEHRTTMTPVRSISYDKHQPEHINFIPPHTVTEAWKGDYGLFAANMVVGEALGYDELIERMKILLTRVRELRQQEVADESAESMPPDSP